MRLRWLSYSTASCALLLNACSNGGFSSADNPVGTGPFDSRGNYVEAWADSPSQWRKGNTAPADATPDKAPAQVPVSPPAVVMKTKETPRSTPVIASNTPKPKPKPKPKPAPVKVKPKTTRHTVKSGDNLYNIAKRYGTSVGAIQRANGIKGSMIRPGQSLVIPR